MGSHDNYGKRIFYQVTGKQISWFNSSQRRFVYPPGGMVADLDGVVGEECVVEIEATNPKQIRGCILDLVLHPHQQKLLVLIPANLGKSAEPETIRQACHRLLDLLIEKHMPKAQGDVILLQGKGGDEERFFESDCAMVRTALIAFGLREYVSLVE